MQFLLLFKISTQAMTNVTCSDQKILLACLWRFDWYWRGLKLRKLVDSVVVVLMCLSMVKSCMVDMDFPFWKLMLF